VPACFDMHNFHCAMIRTRTTACRRASGRSGGEQRDVDEATLVRNGGRGRRATACAVKEARSDRQQEGGETISDVEGFPRLRFRGSVS
jgi:hypothetical protein